MKVAVINLYNQLHMHQNTYAWASASLWLCFRHSLCNGPFWGRYVSC